jgi:ssDNA-binding Zn-finger/Zn-ribbon topoisomerase 1
MTEENPDPIQSTDVCPKCGSPLTEVVTTQSGRKLRRCTAGEWNPKTRRTDGCDFVKWLPFEPQTLDEKCPKCGSALVLTMTRFGKKMKKCSTGGWDKAARKPTGCEYVEWLGGSTEQLDEECPECGEKLVLYTTSSGKKMKKCSTSGWDREKKQATGCTYVEWLKPGASQEPNGEEHLPPEPD